MQIYNYLPEKVGIPEYDQPKLDAPAYRGMSLVDKKCKYIIICQKVALYLSSGLVIVPIILARGRLKLLPLNVGS